MLDDPPLIVRTEEGMQSTTTLFSSSFSIQKRPPDVCAFVNTLGACRLCVFIWYIGVRGLGTSLLRCRQARQSVDMRQEET